MSTSPFLDPLLPTPAPADARYIWAVVTQASPLRIRVDGDRTPLGITPDTLVSGLEVDQRVYCQIFNRRLVVLGASGGSGDTGPSLPLGGTAGQVLAKLSSTDGDADWETITQNVYQVTNNIGDPQFTWALANAVAPLYCVWLEGQAISRTTYAALFEKYNPVVGTTTVTIATPGVFTLTAHGMLTGQMIYLTTTGALPTGLAANTNYWVIWITANTFSLATSEANAFAGTKIATTGSQSGVHTLRTTFGVGNGSTTFNVPDPTGKVLVGQKSSGAFAFGQGATIGAETHTHQHVSPIGQVSGVPQVLKPSDAGLDLVGTQDYNSIASMSKTGVAAPAASNVERFVVTSSASPSAQPSLIGRYYARYADVVLPPAGSTASVGPTPDAVVLRDSAGRGQVSDPVADGDIDTKGARDAAIPGVNLFANPIFAVNQRAAASGTSLALGAYFLDRLKSGTAANAVTWTGDDISGRVLTIPSGKTVISPQERANFPAGVYTISWGGTATGRFYKSGTSAPALAASPITVTADGLADMLAEWGAGTLSWVKIERGAVATPLVRGTFAEELAACLRYYYRITADTGDYCYLSNSAAFSTAIHYGGIRFPVEMRAVPTAASSSAGAIYLFYQGVATTSSAIAFAHHTKRDVRIGVTCTGSVTAGYSSWLQLNPGAWVAFDAEM